MDPIVFLRLKPGCGPERDRVTHLFPTANLFPSVRLQIGGADDPEGTARVLCGLMLIPGTFDVLSDLIGMPCEPCLLNSPGPGGGGERLALAS